MSSRRYCRKFSQTLCDLLNMICCEPAPVTRLPPEQLFPPSSNKNLRPIGMVVFLSYLSLGRFGRFVSRDCRGWHILWHINLILVATPRGKPCYYVRYWVTVISHDSVEPPVTIKKAECCTRHGKLCLSGWWPHGRTRVLAQEADGLTSRLEDLGWRPVERSWTGVKVKRLLSLTVLYTNYNIICNTVLLGLLLDLFCQLSYLRKSASWVLILLTLSMAAVTAPSSVQVFLD